MSTTAPACESDLIIRIWQQLAALRRLSFVARPGPGSTTGWSGRGQAELSPESAGADWRLVERGRFQPAGAARDVAFHNIYRWQRLADGLALSHERFGTDAAVFLFELVDDGQGRLVSRAGHHCGADVYAAQLVPMADGFTLDWTIRGPAKNERLYYHYSTHSPEPANDKRPRHV
ncbi:DUF6314 family protein [Salinisphaera sp. SPP-AMP-43]|uniref:DUF6314 family protein n=1 Tax=Salinisphaera sp. SPP-AMP-43 TaxID=3121288 RepID=UPI003C6E6CDD